jgi:hypothetical protein
MTLYFSLDPLLPKSSTLYALLNVFQSTQFVPLSSLNPSTNSLSLALGNLNLVLNAIELVDGHVELGASRIINVPLGTTTSEPLGG